MPLYIRPLFCEGKGPFRWAALSGDPRGHPDDGPRVAGALSGATRARAVARRSRGERVAFQGLPARICWLGYGERARAGLLFNDLVRRGELRAPIVIGRDHLDARIGGLAQPRDRGHAGRLRRDRGLADSERARQHRLRRDAGSRSITAAASGIGYSIHAGMVVVADGTDAAARRLERVLTADPGHGRDASRRRGISGGDRRGP